ncbi:MAG: hypothetical protein ABR511_06540 [Acidimicrobiales bacterium]
MAGPTRPKELDLRVLGRLVALVTLVLAAATALSFPQTPVYSAAAERAPHAPLGTVGGGTGAVTP